MTPTVTAQPIGQTKPRMGKRLVPCIGEAHGHPYIDNCMMCAPRWGWMEVDDEPPYRICIFKANGTTYTLRVWEWFESRADGKIPIRYRLDAGRAGKARILFAGEDFATPHASDSDDTVKALMGFLTLKPGDTDAEYFEGYTTEQWEFATCDAEGLAMVVMDRFGE